ncbi:MAG TPA: hypothetical protein P5110_02570 [Candidatus Omnitrophota bacterium]|nr:hypothetical protein [Candidatus Omnitrophota bacterium]HRZ14371.1 hypothetical protein [Candidatus Omnitrophota bacterium]
MGQDNNIANVQQLLQDVGAMQTELKAKNDHIQHLESELQNVKHQYGESQWYLGEEKAKRQQQEAMLQGAQQRMQEQEEQLLKLREQNSRLMKELSDAQWFLGEERAKAHGLEEELKHFKHG